MSKVRTFKYALGKTFTSIEYYQDILQAPFSFSLRFFIAYFWLFALVATVFLTWRYYLPLNDFMTTFLPVEIVKVYPQDLVITIQDGAASTNVTEPYYVPLSTLDPIKQELENKVLGASTEPVDNLLVIDTMAKVEDFPQYHTAALLTKHHLTIRNEDGNLETVSLDKASNLVIDKNKIQEWVGIASPYLGYFVPILVVMTWVGMGLFYPLWKLGYALVLAVILYLFARLINRPIPWLKVWQLELHLVMISTTFFTIWWLIRYPIEVPFLETILVTVLGLLILRHLPKKDLVKVA